MDQKKQALYDSIVTEFRAGKTAVQIAQNLNVSTATVRAALKYYAQALADTPFTDKQRSFNKGLAQWAEDRVEKLKAAPNTFVIAPPIDKHTGEGDAEVFERYDHIYECALSGVKQEDIAARFNVSARTVRRILNVRMAAEEGGDIPLDRHSYRISRWAKLRAGDVEHHQPAPDPVSCNEPLTLDDCTKAELIGIVKKLTDVCGPAAEATVELELVRIECLRMIDTLHKLKGAVAP